MKVKDLFFRIAELETFVREAKELNNVTGNHSVQVELKLAHRKLNNLHSILYDEFPGDEEMDKELTTVDCDQ